MYDYNSYNISGMQNTLPVVGSNINNESYLLKAATLNQVAGRKLQASSKKQYKCMLSVGRFALNIINEKPRQMSGFVQILKTGLIGVMKFS